VARDGTVLRVAGQEIRLTTPGRVLYPASGTTKSQVVAYYVEVAAAMLPHLLGRPATRKRWPEGVDGPAFFAKDLEPGTPAWLGRVQVQDNGPKFYPVLETPAGLAWLGQVSALELHVPQWRFGAPTRPVDATASPHVGWPDRVVFDLDPGPGAGLRECVEVASLLRDRLGRLGARSVPVTSGSKGLHVYVPMDDPITSKAASEWAKLVAEQLEKALPELVVTRMAKSLRVGKVLVDWSQNFAVKTTIAPYSLRGRGRPTVAAPRTWDELAEPDLRHLELPEVLERLRGGLDPLSALHVPPTGETITAVVTKDRPSVRRTPPVGQRPHRASPMPPTRAGKTTLPAGLAGPITVELARAEERIPGPHAMPGGSRYEPKWDGFRGSLQIGNGSTRLWSKNGTDLATRFPEIISAVTPVVPDCSVLDGELIIWSDDRLAFDLLQHRFAGGQARAREQARHHPASYVVFDLLALAGEDLRDQPLRDRRAALETLAREWAPPLQLSPMTDDIEVARRWMIDYLIWR
jgi:bifunctional non-homologous end joining protein LigD